MRLKSALALKKVYKSIQIDLHPSELQVQKTPTAAYIFTWCFLLLFIAEYLLHVPGCAATETAIICSKCQGT